MSKTRTKYQQFLESEKTVNEKGWAEIGDFVIIPKDLFMRSLEQTKQLNERIKQNIALNKQIGRVN